jgi:tetratricopeptide (TPR) repeat protein
MTASSISATSEFNRAQRALKAGQRAEALAALQRAISADPNHIEARLWLAGLCPDPQESLRQLAHVLTLNPHHAAAREGIRWARKRLGTDAALPADLAPFVLRYEQAQSPPAPDPANVPVIQPTAQAVPPVERHETSAVAANVTTASSQAHPRKHSASRARRPADFAATTMSAFIVVVTMLCVGMLLGTLVALGWLAYQVASIEPPTPIPAPVVVTNIEPISAQPAPKLAAPLQPTPTYAERADKLLREVDRLWAKSDWEPVIPRVAQALAFQPNDAELRRKLMSAYFNHATALIDVGDLEQALAELAQALEVMPGEPQVQAERDALANYLLGLQKFEQSDWAGAIQWFTKVSRIDAGYLNTPELLFRAYYNQGLILKKQKDLEGALKMFQAAVDLDATNIEARTELAVVKLALAPPPPPPPGENGEKWIDVNLTTQRFRAYEGKKLLYDFKTSTGETARPTQPGRYQVLDKIPMAYSSFWRLWMPYWMGIYWAGASENGIHALPILRNGQTLWAGYLGRRVSFGCVILDTSAAKLIYDWADIGIPVIIHY